MQEAVPISKTAPTQLEGFEDLLDCQTGTEGGIQSEPIGARSGTESEQGGTGGGTYGQYVSLEEAASVLGISVRGVLKRLAKGQLNGKKVPGKTKERWVVDSSGLPQVVRIQVQNETEQTGTEDGIQSEPIGTRGGTKSEQGATEGGTASLRMADAYTQLIAVVERQAAIIQELTADLRSKDSQIKLLTDSQHKSGWWVRFCSWFKAK